MTERPSPDIELDPSVDLADVLRKVLKAGNQPRKSIETAEAGPKVNNSRKPD